MRTIKNLSILMYYPVHPVHSSGAGGRPEPNELNRVKRGMPDDRAIKTPAPEEQEAQAEADQTGDHRAL